MKRNSVSTFAGVTVFEVNSKLFHSLTMAKRKGKHWRTYLEEDDCFAEIREWANKNKGPCLKAPESKVKPTIAPPADKSVKKAPAATQKKAAENNAKQ